MRSIVHPKDCRRRAQCARVLARRDGGIHLNEVNAMIQIGMDIVQLLEDDSAEISIIVAVETPNSRRLSGPLSLNRLPRRPHPRSARKVPRSQWLSSSLVVSDVFTEYERNAYHCDILSRDRRP